MNTARYTIAGYAVAAAAITAASIGVGLSTPRPNYRPPHGTLNPAVTQATIATTICVHGWTATIRPPVAYTSQLKRAQMSARHLHGTTADYEEDHLIPLELGGAPSDPKNLWPERITQARAKDRLENALHTQVCAGTLTLDAAQALIADPATWG